MKLTSNAGAVEFRKSLNVLGSIVKRNVKNQYRNSFLGVVWTVLNPLLNMIVMALVFSNLFGRSLQGADYPVYLLSGNTVFNLMRMATTNALPCIVNNSDLLTKTRIRQYVFPMSNVFGATVNFFFSLVALILVMFIRIPNGVTFHWTMFMTVFPFLPALMLFSGGISLLLCIMYVYFRDIKHIYTVVLTLWMYATPLFYSLEALHLSETMMTIMQINPMYHFVTYFRDITIYGTVPSFASHAIIYGWGIGFFLIGGLIFHFGKNKMMIRL